MKFAEPVAVVGLGGLFPGAPDLDSFWRLIAEGRSAAGEPPAGRWALPVDAAYDAATAAPDKVNSRRGCYLGSIPHDPALAGQDPLVHLAVAAGRQAVRSARLQDVDPARVSVLLGNIALPTDGASALADAILGATFEEKITGRAATPPSVHPKNRYVAGLPAGTLAEALGLGGGACTVDAACASSLYAIAMACEELLSGRADAVLSGGLSRPDAFYTQMGFSQLRAVSPTGACSPFDAKGNGLVVGEGAGFFVLKRLSDALKHGDVIHGLLRGAGLSNDVEGNLLAPSSEGQLRAMRKAYAQTGWDPTDVELIECHATGTPVGDAVEFASLKELWGESGWKRGQCVLGGVKSNVGHLLTGAGAAGLMKVLLAMKHGTLPPTANFERPSPKIDLENSPFRVLSKEEAWETWGPKKAAVSAFGFGGINAHLLVEEYKPGKWAAPKARKKPEAPLAIVGLGAQFGPWKGAKAVSERLLGGGEDKPRTAPRWWGAQDARWFKDAGYDKTDFSGWYVGQVEIPYGKYRVPPKELEDSLPQQLLALEAVHEALSGLSWDGTPHLDAGVFLGIGLDLNTTNFHFRWTLETRAGEWARLLGLELSANELKEWTRRLREAAGPALSANRTMGALGGIVASRVAREFRVGGAGFTVQSEESSGLRALEAAARALRAGDLNTAIVGAVDLAGDVRAVLARHQLKPYAGVVPGEGAGAVVLKRLADAERDGDVIHAVVRDIHSWTGGAELDDPAAARVGDCGAASGMANLLQGVFALREDIQPGFPGGPAFWLRERADGPRRLDVHACGLDGTRVRATLEAYEGKNAAPKSARPLGARQEALFVCEGASALELREDLSRLQTLSRADAGIEALGARWQSRRRKGGALCVALVARTGEELRRLAGESAQRLDAAPQEPIRGPRAFYEPAPLGPDAPVAFLYPGSGNQFPGMGRALGAQWPEVLRRQDAENKHLKRQYVPDLAWTPSGGPAFHDATKELIFGQVSLGSLVTDVLMRCGLKPSAVVGYSLGESAGLISTRAWRERDAMHKRMDEGTLFTEDLAGPCKSVRKAWKLKKGETVDWTLGVLDVPAAAVRAALKGRKKVYLLIVNTPQECVVGGERKAVEALVAKTGGRYLELRGVTTVHCEVAKPVAKAYRDLHLFPTRGPEGVTYYSGNAGTAIKLSRAAAADSIVNNALHGIDYPATIESAYADGARVFVEMGPGASCTRMVGKILQGKPHLAVAACHDAGEPVSLILKTLAALSAQRIPLDLGGLFLPEPAPADGKPRITVPCGGDAFDPPVPKKQVAVSAGRVKPAPKPAPVLVGDPTMAAHQAFLDVSNRIAETYAKTLAYQMELVEAMRSGAPLPSAPVAPERKVVFNKSQCDEIAVGKIGNVLGPDFAEVDAHPTRVRLPDAPLQLVDRITALEGAPKSMSTGRVVTEHDVKPGAWYLDGDRIPTCIAVEAGQADLFLSGYLGIDFITKGLAVYRLLDAVVTFHQGLPEPGATIVYDIRINEFFRQGDTHLFRFEFDATVNGEPLLTMRKGCAGFFTQEELDAGKGIVHTKLDTQPRPGVKPADYEHFTPQAVESYSAEQVEALRRGHLEAAFGPAFAGLPVQNPLPLPGGRMKLIDRVVELDPDGGRFGLGRIKAEADIHPEDWFLTCHFSDDMVMPGTLMYECCLHTLRVQLMRMGWVSEAGASHWEPVPGKAGRLKCRGQVIPSTQLAAYEISIKEFGFEDDGTPYVAADALMYSDGRPVVEMIDMSLRLKGQTQAGLEALWKGRKAEEKEVLFDTESITAFAIGKPSEAFGDKYKVFDAERKIARLPGPPFQFLDRVTKIEGGQQWVLKAGTTIEAEYDVPRDAWYFAADRQAGMPFAVLLETALQPCGWLAAYLGSALTSDVDLSFRNLGGSSIQHAAVPPDTGTLTTQVKITGVSQSGGMIIQHFAYEMRAGSKLVYTGTTYFGFFSKQALADQVGIREAVVYEPPQADKDRARSFPLRREAPMPGDKWRMVDRVDLWIPDGGPAGLGFIRGSVDVREDFWFFKAHFYEDPVWPGSLGLESFLQLLKNAAVEKWGLGADARFQCLHLGAKHEWVYRGQVLPTDGTVTVQAEITAQDEAAKTLTAHGFLTVDGRVIYEMKDFTLKVDA